MSAPSLSHAAPGGHARWRLLAGVFLAFATVGLLLDLSLAVRRPWYSVLYSSVCAGLISAGWAYAWQRNKRLIFLIAPLTILYQPAFDFLFPPASLAHAVMRGGFDPLRTLEAAACLACIVCAYILFTSYVRWEEARHQRIQVEMQLAQRIHDSLVPPIHRRTPHYEVLGASLSSSEMGGDLLDCLDSSDEALLVVADVSGHGVAAGVLMAMLKSALYSSFSQARELKNLVSDINRVMHDLTAPEKFATFSALRMGSGSRVHYALAGHLPILWYQAGPGALVELPNENLPLGVAAHDDFEVHAVEVEAGDLFVLLTDGIIETMNARGELFGDERVRSLLLKHARDPLQRIQEELMSAVASFGPRTDDQTILLVRWEPHEVPVAGV